MAQKFNGFWSAAVWVALVGALSAQAPSQPAAPAAQESPTFRVQIDAVTMDVIVKDPQGRFISDLKKEEFEIYEDGVKQELASMTMSHGGRVTNVLEAPPAAAPEGVILPPVRRINDTSGRIFLFFVDDLHLQFQSSGRVRELFKKISKQLVHEGDMFGIVSSGPSSIAIDMTYDRKRMDEAINKIAGDGLKPTEIIQTSSGAGGPSELRHRAHVAFATMYEALQNLERVHNRRKALVWVSEGYDLNPFQESRLGLRDSSSPFTQNQSNVMQNNPSGDDGTTGRQVDPMINSNNSPRRSATRTWRASSVRSRGRRTAPTRRFIRSIPADWSPGRTSTNRSIPRSGRRSCASPRMGCVCWRRKRAASPWST